MGSLVITVIGDDRAGLVSALSGAIAKHGGNWDRSHMAELAGKFAGIVLVTIPSSKVDALGADLEKIETSGLLDITVEHARGTDDADHGTQVTLSLVGQDHPGIVHDISSALAAKNISIDDLQTETASAPMGGYLFRAEAVLELPPDLSVDDLQDALEAVADDLMVDLDLTEG